MCGIFCTNCGRCRGENNLGKVKVCDKCGQKNSLNALECVSCGSDQLTVVQMGEVIASTGPQVAPPGTPQESSASTILPPGVDNRTAKPAASVIAPPGTAQAPKAFAV